MHQSGKGTKHMAGTARIRFSITAGEFEVEGDVDFISRYDELLLEVLKRMSDAAPALMLAKAKPSAPGVADPSQDAPLVPDIPEFGEALHRLPKNVSGTDQILVAAFYASRKSSARTFATGDANRLLVEQGVKLSNPSQSIKSNIDAKRVFKVDSSYRISRDGLEHVARLLNLEGASL
jgi:hypothetical protein